MNEADPLFIAELEKRLASVGHGDTRGLVKVYEDFVGDGDHLLRSTLSEAQFRYTQHYQRITGALVA